jgi:hypothetical protein
MSDMARRTAHVAAIGALLLAGCGSSQPDPLPAACIDAPATIERALQRAPAQVRLDDGTALSRCVHRAAGRDGDLQTLGVSLMRVADDLKQPNGLIGPPDGKILYVADIGANKTYVYDIQADGTLANKKLFCELGSDGMTIDNEGNVYLTGKGVTVFDKTGRQIEHIAVDEPWTANVCFGGADKHTLFITASKSLYALTMRTYGVGSQ